MHTVRKQILKHQLVNKRVIKQKNCKSPNKNFYFCKKNIWER